ncbi:pilus assembly protein TadG-related protein [Thalassiella azotivora]
MTGRDAQPLARSGRPRRLLRAVLGRVRGADREAGAVAAFVVAIAVALFAIGGLVIDGGRAINARQRVADDAEQAARVGADKVDVAALRTRGDVVIDPGAATSAAYGYLAGAPGGGYSGADARVVATPTEVTVRTSTTVQSTILGIVGFGQFTVTGEATARPAAGIDAEF